MDVHEETSTVREALIFSAVLRQPSTVPYEEKLDYVEHIIELLELQDICDALIGGMYSVVYAGICKYLTDFSVPGAGLSIEQRKRVTLGVELVAKPTLLFLDEPTSGLDGQSAYNIVRFLRKLVDGGQAVLVCIGPSRLTGFFDITNAIFSVHDSSTFCCIIRGIRFATAPCKRRKDDILRTK